MSATQALNIAASGVLIYGAVKGNIKLVRYGLVGQLAVVALARTRVS